MKVIENLQAYQNGMKVWRDKKVKEKIIEVKDLVLLQTHVESPLEN
jgi:hypothetical protein